MKQSLIFKYLVLTLFACGTMACNDFLREDPKGQMATVNFFLTRSDLDLATHALIRNVYHYSANNEYYCSFALGSDMQARVTGCGDGELEYELRQWAPSNSGVKKEWAEYYIVIKSANFIINHAGSTPAEPEIIDAYLAQAYFWRAWAYFRLVNIYGPVPMILDEKVDYTVGASSIAEIWEKVIFPDMEKAEKAPAKWADVPGCAPQAKIGNNGNGNSWVTQAAAKAATAYLYLSYAGWPNNKTEYYALAAAKAKEVIDGVENGTYPFALLNDYTRVYSKVYELANTESLLSVYLNMNVYESSTWDSKLIPNDIASYDINGKVNKSDSGWSEVYGEIKWWADFPAGPRKMALYPPKALILKIESIRNPITGEKENATVGKLVDWWSEDREQVHRCPYFGMMQVQCDPSKLATGYAGDWDYTKGYTGCNGYGDKARQIIRLSEVYCWYAEAVGRSGQGDAAKAAALLQQLTDRADDTPQNYTGLTGVALAEAAYREHGWEVTGSWWGNIAPVFCDEIRMYRVKDHWEQQLANEEVEVAPGVKVRTPYAEGIGPKGAWSDERTYAPYPAQETDVNPNLHK